MTGSSCKCLPKHHLPDNLKKHVTLDYSHRRNVSAMKDQLQQEAQNLDVLSTLSLWRMHWWQTEHREDELFTGEYTQV